MDNHSIITTIVIGRNAKTLHNGAFVLQLHQSAYTRMIVATIIITIVIIIIINIIISPLSLSF